MSAKKARRNCIVRQCVWVHAENNRISFIAHFREKNYTRYIRRHLQLHLGLRRICMYVHMYAHSLDSLQLCNMLIVSRGSWAWQVQKTQPRFLLPQHLLPFLFTETSSHFQPHSRVQHSCSSRRLIAVIGRVFHTFHERS